MEIYTGLTSSFGFNTNGFQGGDAGHGSSTIINFMNHSGSIYIDGQEIENDTEHKIVFQGDWELMDLMGACYHLLQCLEKITKVKAAEIEDKYHTIQLTDTLYDQ